jgi:hypothetical protein
MLKHELQRPTAAKEKTLPAVPPSAEALLPAALLVFLAAARDDEHGHGQTDYPSGSHLFFSDWSAPHASRACCNSLLSWFSACPSQVEWIFPSG